MPQSSNPPLRTNKDRVEAADLTLWLYRAPSSIERDPGSRIEAATDLMIDLLHFICNETKKAALTEKEAFNFEEFMDEYVEEGLFNSLRGNFREEYGEDGPYPADKETPCSPPSSPPSS